MANVQRTPHKKACNFCNKDFFAPRRDRKFCSRICSSHSVAKHIDANAPKTYDIICANVQCAKPFAVREHYAQSLERRGGTRPKYCSKECYRISHKSRPKPSKMACSKCNKIMPYTSQFFSKNSHRSSTFGLNRQCKKCVAETYRESNKLYRDKLRIQVLTTYGNGKLACVCCGEDHHEFLSLDHIYGDGHLERKKLSNGQPSKRKSNQNIFYRLRKQGFPKGRHRTLCMNCNFARGKYGYCPHELLFS